MALAAGALLAQQPPPAALTVMQAVQNALHNYPSIQVSQEQINAAAAGIRLARTAYLPRVDALAQVNRATRNNVFGLLLPQSVIPSMSGPVIGSNNLGTAWGSAIGTLVTWEPFDFGLRRATVAAAAAAQAQSEATLKRTQFEVAAAAADAYLTLVAAQETVRAAQAGVDRAEVIARTTNALVGAELRPGADASRAQAEARRGAHPTDSGPAGRGRGARHGLPLPGHRAGPDSPFLRRGCSSRRRRNPSRRWIPAANPFAAEQSAVVEQTKAQLKALERSYFPRFYLQGSAYARGTGAETDGKLLGGVNGLAPSFQNYALGFSVTFPALDLPSVQAREAAQSAAVRAQTARYRQIAIDLRAQWNAAVATLQGARRIAANTPLQVSAARAAVNRPRPAINRGWGTSMR